ncbi:MAG: glycosyltransferase [bacterium]|nr:glycosyltransferase [bacterium]
MKRMTVSLCIIARDEEATIGTAIKSVLALVDEVIVVDTGSRDNTRIIAEGYGARVVETPWVDDFAAARNMGLAEVACDWVLVLDADETLQPYRPVEFQRLLHDPRVAGYRVQVVSPRLEAAPEGRRQLRLFRSGPDIRYRFPIHEQVSPAVEERARQCDQFITDSNLAILHEGHSPERHLRRRERNQRILQKAVSAHPDEPYFPYRLGCEGMSRLEEEILPVAGLQEALGRLRAAWRLVGKLDRRERQQLNWFADLGVRMVSGLLALERVDEARETMAGLRDALPDHPQVVLHAVATDLRYLRDRHENLAPPVAARLIAAAREDLLQLRAGLVASTAEAMDSRVRDLYPLRYLGELALLEGRVTEAAERFEQALELDPSYSHAWLGMAECSRFAGDHKRAMKLYLRTITESEWNYRAWFRGSDLMMAMGFRDNGLSWRRTATDRFAEHPEVKRDRQGDVVSGEKSPQPA